MRVQKLFFGFFLWALSYGANAQYPLNFGFEQGSTCDKMPFLWSLVSFQNGVMAEQSSQLKLKGQYSLRVKQESNSDSTVFNRVEYSIDGSGIAGQKVQFFGHFLNLNFKGKVKVKLDVYTGDPFKGYNLDVTEQKHLDLSTSNQWKRFTLKQVVLPAKDLVIVFQFEFNGTGEFYFDECSLQLNGKNVLAINTGNPLKKSQLKAVEAHTTVLEKSTASAGGQSEADIDLNQIKPMLQKASLIGLGESTHGTRDFFQLKHRVLEYAVNQLGVRLFLLEDNMMNCEMVNQYVSTGKGDLKTMMRSLFGVWFRQEVVDMIEWIKAYNQAHPKDMIRFAGIDVQDVGPAFDSLRFYLKKHLPDLVEPSAQLLKDYEENKYSWYMISDTLRNQTWFKNARANYKLVKDGLEVLQKTKPMAKDSVEWVWTLQYANLLQQGARNISTNYLSFYRDSAMAENIQWFLKLYPNTKAVVWAHDAHISKGSDPIKEHNYYNGMSMGAWLHKWMGSAYVCFGLSTYKASFTAQVSYMDRTICNCETSLAPRGSFEYALHQMYKGKKGVGLIVNLQEMKKNQDQFAFMHHPFLIRMNNHVCLPYAFGSRHTLPFQFDGLFFIDSTTGSTLVK